MINNSQYWKFSKKFFDNWQNQKKEKLNTRKLQYQKLITLL